MKIFKIDINSFKLGSSNFLELQNSNMRYMGAKKLVNFIPRNNNILTKRPGTIHLSDFNPEQIKVIKFITIDFAKDTFLLEFTLGKLRLFKNNHLVLNEKGKPLVINTPYVIDTYIYSINCTKNNIRNSVYVFCSEIRPYILTIESKVNIQVSLTPMEFIDGPYEDINTTGISLTPQNRGGSEVNIKASADIFTKNDLNRHLRLYDEKSRIWGWGIINKFINNSHIQVDVKKEFASTNPTIYWRKGVFNTDKDNPSLGIIFNSRLYLANSSSVKTRVWASCYNDFLRFSPTTNQDEFNLVGNIPDTITYTSSITFVISEIKEITWLSLTAQYVIIGSEEGVFALMPLDFSKSLSPYNFVINKLTNNASPILAVTGNTKFIGYINDSNNITILEYNNDPIIPKIVDNILSNTVIRQTNLSIINLYLTSLYENIITLFFNNGSIGFVNINIIENEYVYAFSEVLLGGNNSIVKAVSGNNKFLYLLVERTIKNKPIYTLEYIDWKDLDRSLENSINLNHIQYLDCRSISEYTTPTNFIPIQKYVNLAIIADDYYLGEFSSNRSYLILQKNISKVVKGYNFISHYQTLDFSDIEITSSLGNYKKLYTITIGYINSLGGKIFVDDNNIINNLYSIELSDLYNKFFTGYKKIITNFSLQEKLNINIIHDKPFPLNITFIRADLLCR